MRATALVVIVACALAPSVGASTLGLLPCTRDGAAFRSRRPVGRPQLIVARDAEAWERAWTATAQAGKPAAVDFTTSMVVGIINRAKEDRVIYRIELDDAARPQALLVRVGVAGGVCGHVARSDKSARAHLVVTARSSLPVRFVEDGMIDGRMYVSDPAGEGVETKLVGIVPAQAAPLASTLKVPDREDAERIVVESLTEQERRKLRLGPLDRSLPRVPHGWTRLHVEADAERWSVDYDDLHFRVDRRTGTLTRVTPPPER